MGQVEIYDPAAPPNASEVPGNSVFDQLTTPYGLANLTVVAGGIPSFLSKPHFLNVDAPAGAGAEWKRNLSAESSVFE